MVPVEEPSLLAIWTGDDPPPYATKSTSTDGHAPVRAVVLATRATFAFVAPIEMVPVASGVGRLTVPFAPSPFLPGPVE